MNERIIYYIFICLFFNLISCDNKEGLNSITLIVSPSPLVRTEKKDSVPQSLINGDSSNSKQVKLDSNSVPKPQVIISIPPIMYENPPISCFNPNLKIEDAIDLINSWAVDTQEFIVERKEVPNHPDYFTENDTIFLKQEFQNIGWNLIDSTQTKVGNQVQISIKMLKNDRVCNITKILYLSNNEKNNSREEGFDIREFK